MDAEAAAIAREMKDRYEIYDCIMRYCSGIDRLDRELLLSAYHPDALDDHGSTYIGDVQGFAEAALALHSTYQEYTQHQITNH
ncbi:MAG TPA: nuclear transport factor 2 family protein, partial [Novosphingobium sp.]